MVGLKKLIGRIVFVDFNVLNYFARFVLAISRKL